jgi:hypothetical protein
MMIFEHKINNQRMLNLTIKRQPFPTKANHLFYAWPVDAANFYLWSSVVCSFDLKNSKFITA